MSTIDEQIRRAMAEGQFDNLPGHGKPLDLDENPFSDPGWRLAYRALQNAGYSLPWIEKRRAIEAELVRTREALQQAWAWRNSQATQIYPPEVVQGEWDRAAAAFRAQIEALNRRILSYNLEAPTQHFHIRLIDSERELELTLMPPSDTLPE